MQYDAYVGLCYNLPNMPADPITKTGSLLYTGAVSLNRLQLRTDYTFGKLYYSNNIIIIMYYVLLHVYIPT